MIYILDIYNVIFGATALMVLLRVDFHTFSTFRMKKNQYNVLFVQTKHISCLFMSLYKYIYAYKDYMCTLPKSTMRWFAERLQTQYTNTRKHSNLHEGDANDIYLHYDDEYEWGWNMYTLYLVRSNLWKRNQISRSDAILQMELKYL